MFLPCSLIKINIVGSLCDREGASSASDRQGFNFESCVWGAMSSHLSHHPRGVLLAQFSLYVPIKTHSFDFSQGAKSYLCTFRVHAVYICMCGMIITGR